MNLLVCLLAMAAGACAAAYPPPEPPFEIVEARARDAAPPDEAADPSPARALR